MQRRDGWYQRKSYPHFDQPLQFEAAKSICEDQNGVAKNSFLPFICFENKQRRFEPNGSAKKYKNKIRSLRYPSHRDGYIYSFYAKTLQDNYELFLSTSPWSRSVLGYRSKIGSNVDQAVDAFKEIASRGNCTAVAMDISDFFPSIDHSVLLRNLKKILAVTHLPSDWHAVYRSMTNFAWVEREALLDVGGFPDGKLPRPIASMKQFRRVAEQYQEFCHGQPGRPWNSSRISNICCDV